VRTLVWFSCGAASAVAARIAVKEWPDCEVVYCDTSKHEHPDNKRFKADVEHWIGRPIKSLRSDKYEDIFDVFERTGWLVGPKGARCTTELKKKVREAYQRPGDLHVFGLTADEQTRIDKFESRHPDLDCAWVLAEAGINKTDCYDIIRRAGIELPAMYRLGFNNNNCIGCVKGSVGYWNRIRQHFPDAFDRMAKLERRLGVAICRRGGGARERVYLDELDPNEGRHDPPQLMSCGLLCYGTGQDLIGRWTDD
jgi:hypothetical protein